MNAAHEDHFVLGSEDHRLQRGTLLGATTLTCLEVEPENVIVYQNACVNCMCWVQESQDFDAYQSDHEHGKHTCGPEMLETWLLLEFCDRSAAAAISLWLHGYRIARIAGPPARQ